MKSSNVVSIGDVPISGTVNEGVVALLENFLGYARRGEIEAVAVTAVRPNHRIVHDAAHTWNHFLLLSAIDILHHEELNKLTASSIEEDYTPPHDGAA